MAISIAWSLSGDIVVTVPKADTTLVSAGPPEIRSYNVNTLKQAVMDLYASTEGGLYPIPYFRDQESVLSGLTYGRKLRLLPPYRIEFEDGQYSVVLEGGNHNVVDVRSVNQVSLVTNNSAGLLNNNVGLALTVRDQSVVGATPGTMGYAALRSLYNDGRGVCVTVDPTSGTSGAVLGVNGTPGNPVDNETDARTLADALGTKTYAIPDGVLTLTVDHTYWTFRASGETGYFGTVDFGGVDVSSSWVIDLYAQGDADNNYVYYIDSWVFASNVSGDLRDCIIDDISVIGARFINCTQLSFGLGSTARITAGTSTNGGNVAGTMFARFDNWTGVGGEEIHFRTLELLDRFAEDKFGSESAWIAYHEIENETDLYLG